ncbi:hypothetical protein ES703_103430 [subsurface metagenome]
MRFFHIIIDTACQGPGSSGGLDKSIVQFCPKGSVSLFQCRGSLLLELTNPFIEYPVLFQIGDPGPKKRPHITSYLKLRIMYEGPIINAVAHPFRLFAGGIGENHFLA